MAGGSLGTWDSAFRLVCGVSREVEWDLAFASGPCTLGGGASHVYGAIPVPRVARTILRKIANINENLFKIKIVKRETAVGTYGLRLGTGTWGRA